MAPFASQNTSYGSLAVIENSIMELLPVFYEVFVPEVMAQALDYILWYC